VEDPTKLLVDARRLAAQKECPKPEGFGLRDLVGARMILRVCRLAESLTSELVRVTDERDCYLQGLEKYQDQLASVQARMDMMVRLSCKKSWLEGQLEHIERAGLDEVVPEGVSAPPENKGVVALRAEVEARDQKIKRLYVRLAAQQNHLDRIRQTVDDDDPCGHLGGATHDNGMCLLCGRIPPGG